MTAVVMPAFGPWVWTAMVAVSVLVVFALAWSNDVLPNATTRTRLVSAVAVALLLVAVTEGPVVTSSVIMECSSWGCILDTIFW